MLLVDRFRRTWAGLRRRRIEGRCRLFIEALVEDGEVDFALGLEKLLELWRIGAAHRAIDSLEQTWRAFVRELGPGPGRDGH